MRKEIGYSQIWFELEHKSGGFNYKNLLCKSDVTERWHKPRIIHDAVIFSISADFR